MAGGHGHGKKDDHHAPTPDPKGSKGGSKGPKQGVWGEMLGKMSGWIGALALIIPTAITARFAALGNDNARDAFTGFAGEWFEDKSEKLIKNPGPWLKKHLPKIKPFFKDETVNAALSELAGFLVKEGAGKHKGAYFFGEILTRGLKGVGEGLSEEAEIEALLEGLGDEGTGKKKDENFIGFPGVEFAHWAPNGTTKCKRALKQKANLEWERRRKVTAPMRKEMKSKDGGVTIMDGIVTDDVIDPIKGVLGTAEEMGIDEGLCPTCTPVSPLYDAYVRVRNPMNLPPPPKEEPKPKDDHADHHDESKGFAAKVKAVVGGFRDMAGVVVETINPNPHRLDELAKLKGKRANSKIEIDRLAGELRKQDPNHPLLEQLKATQPKAKPASK